MKPEEAQEAINHRIMEMQAEKPYVHSVTDLRVYRPREGEFPVVLLVHGGGWVGGNLDTHDHLARYLCNQAEVVVVSVGYANSPEAKFPTALEQCYEALQLVKPVAIVGDSAGGNMAASLCLMARDRNGPEPLVQVLINPCPDLTISDEAMQWFAKQYVADDEQLTAPYASPLFADDLTRLPDAMIIVGEEDPLYQSGVEYAKRLRQADVSVELYVQKGVGHLAGNAARVTPLAKEPIDAALSFITSRVGAREKAPAEK